MSLAPIHRYIGRIVHLMRKEKGMRQSELALLTGLKQPNLSRIENGLVSPRPVTLDKIAKALGVEVQEFYSEKKVQEVERKWAASLGPKHAALLLAGKLTPIPLIDTSQGYGVALDLGGAPQGPLEVVLQLPPGNDLGESNTFAVRVHGDSMQAPGAAENFPPGEIVIFSGHQEVHSGDFAFVMLRETSIFRRVFMDSPNYVRLVSLNPALQEQVVLRTEVRKMWKLVGQFKKYQ